MAVNLTKYDLESSIPYSNLTEWRLVRESIDNICNKIDKTTDCHTTESYSTVNDFGDEDNGVDI